MRSGWLVLLLMLPLACIAQLEQSPLQVFGSFEVPKNERVRLVHITPAGDPIIVSTTNDAIFLRPMDPATGFPTRLLAIRSNEVKQVKQFEMIGDSIICLVQSSEASTRQYETVVYTIRNNMLAEAHRRTVEFNESQAKKNAQPLHFNVSTNGKWTLVARQLAYSRNKKATLFVELCKHPEDSVIRKRLPLPYEADDIIILGTWVGDDGILYFTAKTGVKLNSPFLSKWLVYSFNATNDELHEFDLTINKVFPNELKMHMTSQGLVIAAPYATNPFKTREAAGFLYVSLNKQGTAVTSKAVQPFLPALMMPFQNEDQRDEDHIQHISLNKIIEAANAPLLLMAQSYSDQICTTDPRTGIMTCTDQYYHNAIMVCNPLNQVQSMIIERRQMDYNNEGPYLGEQAFEFDGKFITLYNDHAKNEGIQAQRVMNNPSRAALRYVVYAPDSKIETAMMETQGIQGQIFLASVPPVIRDNTAYMVYSNGRDFSMATLDLRIIKNTP